VIHAIANTERAGGTRYSEGKPRGAWFLPVLGLRLVQRVAMNGAEKYAPRDWFEGQSYSTLLDCAWSHTLKVMIYGPKAIDEESGCYHAAHAAWNWLALLAFIEMGRADVDDVTPWFGVNAERKREALREAAAGDVEVLELLRTAGGGA